VTAAPPDYVRVFHAVPVPLLLTPDLEVADANRAWLDRAAPMLDRSLLHASLQDGVPDTPGWARCLTML
jgi:hypothetical protein